MFEKTEGIHLELQSSILYFFELQIRTVELMDFRTEMIT